MTGPAAVDFGEGIANAWSATATFAPDALLGTVASVFLRGRGRELTGPMRRPGRQLLPQDHDQQRRHPGGPRRTADQ
jgi:hypothetical protein